MRRSIAVLGLMAAGLFLATPEPARADSLFGGHFGGFIPKGLESRDINTDVLRQNVDFLDYNFNCTREDPVRCFSGLSFSGEYLIGFGDWIEAGVSVGYYSKKVHSVYLDFEDADGTEIDGDTTLKNIPVAVTVRAFPIGRTTPVQPYVGGGVAFQRWGYKEAGEFVDFTPGAGRPIFTDEYDDKGTAVGPTILAGVRAPVGDNFLIGGEVRWTGGSADLNPDFNFAGTKLELGGVSVMAGFHVKF
jgi:opacity protein-like surface antigen